MKVKVNGHRLCDNGRRRVKSNPGLLTRSELIAARLFTGPMYLKYQNALRGDFRPGQDDGQDKTSLVAPGQARRQGLGEDYR